MGIRNWLQARSHGDARRNTKRRNRPILYTLEDRTVPAVVGYYDMGGFGQGVSTQVQPILTSGNTAVQLFNLTAGDLAGIDVLFIQNPNNAGYHSEYLNNIAAIRAAVNAGMTLIIHDRFVDGAETILPGGSGFNIVRNFTDAANINVRDNSTLLTNGPGGVITNSTLDGGNFSDHGFAFAGSLPANARLILTTGDPTHIVTFSYTYGFGNVVYSSIPLDAYLSSNNTPTAMKTVYAPNVVAYGVDLLNVNPVANPGDFQVDEDSSFQGQLSATDADGDALAFSITTQPQHGTVELINATTGSYIYHYESNFFGNDSFTYTVSDTRGGSSTSTVTFTINPINDSPIAFPGSATLDEDSSFEGQLSATDIDGDALTFGVAIQPQHGTVQILDASTGAYRYTPEANYHGDDSFTFAVVDPHGGASLASVSVTVNSVDDAPVANPGTATVDEDSAVEGQLSATDADGDALTFSIANQPLNGTVELLDASTGAYRYTPAANYNGGDSFTFTVTDPDGNSTTAMVSLTVNSVNDLPTAEASPDLVLTVGESGQLTANAVDADGDALSCCWNLGDGTVLSGSSIAHCFAKAGTYTVLLTVDDGNGGTATDTVTVTVETPPATTPVLTITGPCEGRPGKPLTLRAALNDSASSTSYKMTWRVYNPHGRLWAAKVGNTVQFKPGKPGVYTVVCTVTNKDGTVATATYQVTIIAPSANGLEHRKKGK